MFPRRIISLVVLFIMLSSFSAALVGEDFIIQSENSEAIPNWIKEDFDFFNGRGTRAEESSNVEFLSRLLYGLALDVIVVGNYAYVCAGSNLLVFDVTNKADPQIIGTAGLQTMAAAIDIVGNYAYVADAYYGLVIFDIVDPSNPTWVGDYDIEADPTINKFVFDVSVSGSYAYLATVDSGLMAILISTPSNPQFAGDWRDYWVTGVKAVGSTIYCACFTDGLRIVDMSTPSAPSEIGSVPSIWAFGLNVFGTVAYVYDSQDTLWPVDVSIPSNPSIMTTYPMEDPDGIYVDEANDIAYVANGWIGLTILDVSNPSAPSEFSSHDTGDYAMEVYQSGNYAFVASSKDGLLIVDVTLPNQPINASTYFTGSGCSGAVAEGNIAYIAGNSAGLGIYDVSDTSNPSELSFPNEWNNGISLFGNLAYLIDDDELIVMDVVDPENPFERGDTWLSGYSEDIFVDWPYAYIAMGVDGVSIVDVNIPSSPYEDVVYPDANDAKGLHVSGDYLYIANGNDGFNIADISTPTSPNSVVNLPMPDTALDLFIKGDYAYLAINESGLRIYDISTPTSPQLEDTFDTNGNAQGVFVTGGYAFVADGYEGLRVIDVGNPSNPTEVGYYQTNVNADQVFVYNSVAYVNSYAAGLYLLDVSQFSAPGIESTFPEPDSIDIPVDTNIIINFTEPMDTTSVQNAFSYTDYAQTWDVSSGTVDWSDGDRSFTFTPNSDLANGIEYNVTIAHTASDKDGDLLDADGDGNPGEPVEDDYSWIFTTLPAPPQIVSTYPENEALDALVNTSIVINFSNQMNTASVEDAFSYTNGTTVWDVTSGVGVWTDGDRVFTFTPDDDLQYIKQYWFTVTYEAMDIDGILLDSDDDGTPGEPDEDDYTWEFTTLPEYPKVEATFPQDGSIDVIINTTMNITFSKAMERASTQSAFSYSDGDSTWTATSGDITWLDGDRTMQFTPFFLLENEKMFNVTVASTAQDTGGASLDGDNDGVGGEAGEDDYTWSFTIADPPPKVDSTDPQNGALNLPVDTAIRINFSRQMNRNSVQDAFNMTNGTETWDISAGIVSWMDSNKKFMFTPSFQLERGQEYQVTIAHTAMDFKNILLDSDGDMLPGEGSEDDFTFAFTTIPSPPSVVSHFPQNGATLVLIDSSVIFNFSKSMDQTTTKDAFTFTDGVTNYKATNGVVVWSNNDMTMTFTPYSKFLYDKLYTFKVDHTATNVVGAGLDSDGDGVGGEGPADDFSFTFTTMPIPGKVTSVLPTNFATKILHDTQVEIRFSKSMDEPSCEEAFSFTYDGTNETWDINHGNVSWYSESTIMKFSPGFDLEHEKEYTFTLLATAMDEDGITLDGNRNKLPEGVGIDDYMWSFTIIPDAPTVVSVVPEDRMDEVLPDVDIVITFDKSMNKDSVEDAFSYTYPGAPDEYDIRSGSPEWTNDDKVLTFTPDSELEEGVKYTFTIDETAKDTQGIMFEGYEWEFTTKINEEPVLEGGGVFPEEGDVNTMFKFTIVYRDDDDDEPTRIRVWIDGNPSKMKESDPSENSYIDGKAYEYELELDEGEHEYYFEAEDDEHEHEVRYPTGSATKKLDVIAEENGKVFGMFEEEYAGMPTMICGPLGLIILIAIIISVILVTRKRRAAAAPPAATETMTFDAMGGEGAETMGFMPMEEEEFMTFDTFEETPSFEEAKPVVIQCPECKEHLRVSSATRPFMFPCKCGAKLILK